MNLTYSFLRDELALMEIRKHKWIESEKAGAEIGFATAAHDWINKYGYTWKQFRLDSTDNQDILTEKRSYRRFKCHLPIIFTLTHDRFASFTSDVGLIGFSCTIPVYLRENTTVKVIIRFPRDGTLKQADQFQFESTVLRASPLAQKKSSLCHNVFLNFNEDVRDHLRENPYLLSAAKV